MLQGQSEIGRKHNFFNEKLNLSHQKYKKAHLHDGIIKYAKLEKHPVDTLGDMACTNKNVNRQDRGRKFSTQKKNNSLTS